MIRRSEVDTSSPEKVRFNAALSALEHARRSTCRKGSSSDAGWEAKTETKTSQLGRVDGTPQGVKAILGNGII
jgi:hypothetical protein